MPEKVIFIGDLSEAEEFIAGDGCTLRELLHPGKQPLALGYSLEPGSSSVTAAMQTWCSSAWWTRPGV